MSETVIVIDLEGRIENLHPVAERLSGTALGKAVGQPMTQPVPLLDELSLDRLGRPTVTGASVAACRLQPWGK